MNSVRTSALLAGLSFAPSQVLAVEWYENTNANCSGVASIGAAFGAVAGAGPALSSGPGPGRVFATLSAEHYNKLKKVEKDELGSPTVLDDARAKSLAAILDEQGTSSQVPMSANLAIGALTGWALPATPGTLSGLLFSHLFDKLNMVATSLSVASRFVAEGGEVYRRSALLRRQAGQEIFLNDSLEYRVSVGRERRWFVVYGCIYALRVNVAEFHTPSGAPNAKIVKKDASGVWRIWDVEDQRFSIEPLIYHKQEAEFYHFERDSGGNNDSYRLSFSGGPWQRRSSDAAPDAWQTLYQALEAR